MKALLVFASVHEVMEAEAALKEQHLEVEMIPAPRAISSDCGMCIEIDEEELDGALERLQGETVPAAVYAVRGKRYVRL